MTLDAAAGYLSAEDCRLADLIDLVSQKTDLADYPYASTVDQNVLSYDGARLRTELSRPACRPRVEAELARALLDGPGIVVLAGALDDPWVIDRATRQFEAIIAAQRAAGGAAGDHFAAAGQNDRIWNALEKLALRAPEVFADYYANNLIAAVCRAWLGPATRCCSERARGRAPQENRRDMNELEGRGAAWTEDRGTSDEERRPLTGAWQASGQQSLLPDRVVLIAGGTAGLGAGIARAAAREGALVAVAGRRREPGEALAAELTEAGTKALFVQADVADVAQARACAAAVIAAFGRVDSLVNAAGLTARGTLLDTTPELFDAHIAANLKAPFFLMQAVVADLVARQAPGTIVNIISTSEHGGQPYLAPYVAAKAGLAGLTRNAAHAHRWDKIRINGLNIGWTDTEGEDATQRRFHGAGDDWRAKAGASLPMGKLGQIGEIADFVVFLLSDRSGVVTGSVIDWDQNVLGGMD